MKSSMRRVSRAYLVSLRRTRTSGDWRTSLREWRWPEEEWTRMKFGFWARRALLPVRVAVSRMNFRKEVAVKPGLARRMGLDSVRSIWRMRVSNVVWKNLSSP